MKPNRLIESLSGKRPFKSLSQIEQKKSFEKLQHEGEMVKRNYKRLVGGFEMY